MIQSCLDNRCSLLCVITLLICSGTKLSLQTSVAVVFNSVKLEKQGSPGLFNASFERFSSLLPSCQHLDIVYKDLNASFCDLGNFLSFVTGLSAIHVVVLLEDCHCQKQFVFYLDILRINVVSNCEKVILRESDFRKTCGKELENVTHAMKSNSTQGDFFAMALYDQKHFRTLKMLKKFPETICSDRILTNNIVHSLPDATLVLLGRFLKPLEINMFTEYNLIPKALLSKSLAQFSCRSEECADSECECFYDLLYLKTNHADTEWRSKGFWDGGIPLPAVLKVEGNNDIFKATAQAVFRVPVVEYFPFVEKHKFRDDFTECPINSLTCHELDNSTALRYGKIFCCTGWTVDVLTYLSNHLPYKFELYFQENQVYGVFNNETGSWNGVINDILTEKGDIAVDVGLRHDRCALLDCSLGYLFDGFNAITRLKVSQDRDSNKASFTSLVGNFQIFLNPFDVDLLITVLMVFNVFLFLIWATDKICLFYRNKRSGRSKEKFTLLESTSYVWATAFGRDVGDSKKPLTLSARYLSSWLAFLSLIFVNVYVARLMADIVKQKPLTPFTDLRHPKILSKNLKLGVVEGSVMEAYFHTTRDPVLKKAFENVRENLIPTFEGGISAVKNGSLDGFIADTVSLMAALNSDASCSLSLMGKDFSTVAVGFVFRKNWSWAEEFKLQELNMIGHKKTTDLFQQRRKFPSCQAPSSTHPQLGVADISGLFLILIFSILYCCFSLVLENVTSLFTHRFRNSTGRWNLPRRYTGNEFSGKGAVVVTRANFATNVM